MGELHRVREYLLHVGLQLMNFRPNDATQVFLMGIGAAYIGLVDLLSKFGKSLRFAWELIAHYPVHRSMYRAGQYCAMPDWVCCRLLNKFY